MFCTHCGAQAQDTDMFCPGCGAKLKHSAAAATSAASAGTTAGNPFNEAYYQAGQSKPNKKKKANAGAGIIVILMFAVILAMLLFAASRGYLGDSLAGLFSGCVAEDTVPVSGDTEPEPEQDTDLLPLVSDGDAETETTTAATTTTTTTTTEKPTTTTTVNVKKQQAEEIRKLLVAKEWTTELEGYKATIKFKNDGTATITIKVLFITQTIDAKYSVNDECHAVIIGEYNGSTYGISGNISKSSDTKLVVDRDKNMGKVTLTAK